MSNYLVSDSDLISVANAIRTKGGTSASMAFPAGFVSAIEAIPSGGGIGVSFKEVMEKTISAAIDSQVTSIADYAFGFCLSLSIVSFENVSYIGGYAFSGCTSLTSVYAPNLTSIHSSAFYGCTKLSLISFSQLARIEYSTFANCFSVEEAYLPELTYAGTYAFYRCSNMSKIYIPKLETGLNYGSIFYGCNVLESIYAPSATSGGIGPSAFCNCYSLSCVILPQLSGNINNYAFASCRKLISLYLLGSYVMGLNNSSYCFLSTPIAGYMTYTGGVYGSIFVRESLYSSYIAATNWVKYSSRFVSMTDAEISAFLSSL